MKKPEKSRKKSKNSIFLVFWLIFRDHTGILKTFEKINHPGISLFLRFCTFFLDLFFSTYRGDFAKKAKTKSEKMTFFAHLGAVLRKNKSRGFTKKLIYLRENEKKTVKKTRFFSLFFVKKNHTRVKKCRRIYGTPLRSPGAPASGTGGAAAAALAVAVHFHRHVLVCFPIVSEVERHFLSFI